MKKLAQGFNTAAQDSNPVPLSREFDALPLYHGAHFMGTHRQVIAVNMERTLMNINPPDENALVLGVSAS